MFFDHILLQPQNKAQFGKAWLAATRGVRYIKEGQIKEVNIVKLCQHLQEFVVTSSASTKKRFSLRLSAILLHGTIKIFREQVIIFQGEIAMILQKIHIPSGMRHINSSDFQSIFESPPTPVPKIKRKRHAKQVVETPTTQTQTPTDIFQELAEELPRLETVFRPTTTSDMITIRDEITNAPEVEEESFGVLTHKELEEFESIISRPNEPVSQPPRAQVEVVALVHAPKGSFIDTPDLVEDISAIAPPAVFAEVPPVAVSQSAAVSVEPMEVTTQRKADTIAEPPQMRTQAELEAITAIPFAPEPMEVQPPETSVLREIQLEQDHTRVVEERVPKAKERKRKQEVVKHITIVQEKSKKESIERKKFFMKRIRKLFVRINRCQENGGQFVPKVSKLPIKLKSIQNAFLYNLFWSYDDEEIIQPMRAGGSSIRTSSVRDSATLRGVDSISGKTMLERDSTPTPAKETPVLRRRLTLDEQQKQQSIEMMSMPIFSPTKRRTLEVPFVEHPILEQPLIPEQLFTEQQLTPDQPVVPEQPVALEQAVAPDQLAESELASVSKQLTIEQQHQSFVAAVERRIPAKEGTLDLTSDRGVRLCGIVELIDNWDFSQRKLTIEDICEKPMNKLHMARAFADLLTLCAEKYVILHTQESSLELATIGKGPQFFYD